MLKMLHTYAKKDSYECHYKDYDNNTDNNNKTTLTKPTTACISIYLPRKMGMRAITTRLP